MISLIFALWAQIGEGTLPNSSCTDSTASSFQSLCAGGRKKENIFAMHFVGARSSKISNVTVERIDQEALEICWETPLRDLDVSIFMGDSPVTIDRRSPAIRVRGRNTARITELDPEVRYYFYVVPEVGPGVITAERLVPLQGSWNFRDLGGYQTSNGSRVKWGQIYRSDNLSNLTDRDHTLLKNMGLKLVCDFRTPTESNRWPDRLPDGNSIGYLQLPIIHGEREFDFYYENIKKGEVKWLTEEFMINSNIRIIDEYGDTLGKVFHRLAEPESRPLVFHCAGGRDRTGVCTALILLALGVPEETVIYDYCLSEVFISKHREKINERIRSRGVDPETVALYYTATPNFFIPIVNHIREAYGSAANYLRTKAGIDGEFLDLLKQELLE
jgi:protein-tyrosine phosphatase